MTSSVAFWFYVANFCKIFTLKIKQETSRTTSLSFDEINFKLLRKTKNLEKFLRPFHIFKTFATVFTSFLKFHSLSQTCHQSMLSLVGRSLMMLHQKAGRENQKEKKKLMDAFVDFVKKIGILTVDQGRMLVMEKSFIKSNTSKDQTSYFFITSTQLNACLFNLSLETVI